MNRIEMNTVTSERFIASRVNPTSPAPRNAARMGDRPRSMCREMFSSTTIASSTTSPAATISAISDRLFKREAVQVHDRKRADQRDGNRQARDQCGARVAQESEHHEHHQAGGEQQGKTRLV